jgi:hypothetical protein
MRPPKLDFRSFVVKVRLEDEEGKRLHGYITDVSSGDHAYLKDLYDIVDFIARHLRAAEWKLGWGWHIKRWLRRFHFTYL